GSLSVLGNSNPTIPSLVPNLLTVSTPYRTQPIMVQPVLVEVGEKPNIPLSFVASSHVSSGYTLPTSILPLERRCGNCKKIGHQTRDCRVTITQNTQGAAIRNQQGIGCYECGRPGHFRKDYPKLRSQNHGNQTRNKTGKKT
nr:hypothetical protein [Tanacetum cinerariifolium]GFB34551.1 hypothetical protein [Tanacetum cinerariifolium]